MNTISFFSITSLENIDFCEPITIHFGLKSVNITEQGNSFLRLEKKEQSTLRKFYGRHSKKFIIFERKDNSDIVLLNQGGFIPVNSYLFRCVNPKQLRFVRIPKSESILTNEIFAESSIEELEIPDSVTYIDNSCFKNCENLTHIRLSKNLRVIGGSAFEGCTSLRNITIPNGIERIFPYTFSHCKNLKDVSLPKGLSYIGKNAFENCTKLKTLQIPNSLSFIGTDAFRNCNELFTDYRNDILHREGHIKNDVGKNFKELTKLDVYETGFKEAISFLYDLTENGSLSLVKGKSSKEKLLFMMRNSNLYNELCGLKN